MPIIVAVLWLFTGTIFILEYYQELIKTKLVNRFLAMVLLLVAAPFFLIGNCLEDILNILMPQGWNDGDDNNDT